MSLFGHTFHIATFKVTLLWNIPKMQDVDLAAFALNFKGHLGFQHRVWNVVMVINNISKKPMLQLQRKIFVTTQKGTLS